MKATNFFPLLLCLLATSLFSQSNINQSLSVNSTGAAADASAQLDVSANNRGILVPRMNSLERMAIASPATGLLVFDTTTGTFWFFNGSVWMNIAPQTLLTDADNDTKIQVEESPDEDVIRFDLGGTESMVLRKNPSGVPRLELHDALNNLFIGSDAGIANTTGVQNTAVGKEALFSNTSGNHNMALGFEALRSNTSGNNNTAIGRYALTFNTSGINNTGIGFRALYSNTTGDYNTATGVDALNKNTEGLYNVANGFAALVDNTTGNSNTAIGYKAMYDNTVGYENTAIGRQALYSNTEGYGNTATGHFALFSNTFGDNNTASGDLALYSNTTGGYNTANGFNALLSNTTGNYNTANGLIALRYNTTGDYNTANGGQALYFNTTGNNNTANGFNSLFSNTTGDDNTANGRNALQSNTIGSANTANGRSALQFNMTGDNNTADGRNALYSNLTGFQNTASGVNALEENSDGNNNTAIGFSAGDTGTGNDQCTALGAATDVGAASSYTNATAVGYNANTTANNYARIGNTSVTSIGGQVNWSNYSDGRFKRQVQEDVAGLGFITRLRPVTYQWDIHALNDFIPNANDDSTEWAGKYDIEKMRFTGFIAQEVEQAAQKAGFDFSGVDKPQNEFVPYALRYAEFVVPLVKGMQEQQAMIEKQQAEIERLKKIESENAALKSQLDKITAALQGAGIAVER